MELEPWFKLKKYPHIGYPIVKKDYLRIKSYIEKPSNIKKHSFLPLVHKCIAQRKFRADTSSSKKRTRKGKRMRIIKKPKIRHIYYSSHIDSLIYSYYNKILSDSYEEYIKEKKFENSIVAYRKIPIANESNKNKCNIDFAKSIFEHIVAEGDVPLSVIIADVTSFFDNLDHKILKRQWGNVIHTDTLPDDHYNVFKSLTKIRYVEGDQLYNNYGNTMIIQQGQPNCSKTKHYIRKGIKSNKFFKEKNAVAYCTKEDFLKNNLNLIISSNNTKGIPQGSPISATLANIYMLEFDDKVFDKIESVQGLYQRYSDDLIIVCKQTEEDDVIKFLRDTIDDVARLEIHVDKTKLYMFEKIGGVLRGFEVDENTKEINYNKALEYLGFKFDGEKVLIKTSGFSKYYRSMKRSFKKSASLARNSKNPDKSIFKHRLYKRFTHRGAKRKLIYKPSQANPKKYERTTEYYWGNYLSYIYKANDAMKSLNGNDAIKRQGRKFWKKFHNLLKFHSSKI